MARKYDNPSCPEVNPSRVGNFEHLEPRVVMSAQAVASVLPDVAVEPGNAADAIAARNLAPQHAQADVTTMAATSATAAANSSLSPTTAAAQLALQYGLDGTGQTIAVIDTGIAFDHAALGSGYGEGHRVVGGYDFAENDANPYDDGPTGFHGTHVAGIIGSTDARYQGVATGADLVALRVFDDSGATKLEWIESALQWVHDNRNTFENPITTINLSLGTTPDEIFQEVLNDELAQLKADGIFISVAAGNNFDSASKYQLAYPASSSDVVAVASHTSDGSLSDFSQRASHVLTAPGQSITSTVPSHLFFGTRADPFVGSSGTSMAAPYVAAASAILRQANESIGVTGIDQDLLYQQLFSTADQVYDSATNTTYARVNLQAAIESVLGDHQGDTVAKASRAGTLGNGQQIAGTITGTNDVDVVQFRTNDSGVYQFNTTTAASLNADVRVLDSSGNEIAVQRSGDRIRFVADANTDYFLSVGSANGNGAWQVDVAFQAAGAISLDNGVLSIDGTSQDDTLVITATPDGQTIHVDINMTRHSFGAGDVEQILFRGKGGDDDVTINVTGTDDTVTLQNRRVDFANSSLSITAFGIDKAQIHHAGGNDSLVIHGSDTSDTVTASLTKATLKTGDFQATAGSFGKTTVYGNGGQDQITIQGTTGDERFVNDGTTTFVQNNFMELSALGFENVTFNGNGGSDNAVFKGRDLSENFSLNQRAGTANRGNQRINVNNVQRLNVLGSDARDRVSLTGSIGDDQLYSRNGTVSLIAERFRHYVDSFKQLDVTANGGHDRAFLAGGSGNDQFLFQDQLASLQADGSQLTARGFDLTVARAGEGNDVANFVGDHRSQHYWSNQNSVQSKGAAQATGRAIGFDRVNVNAMGGHDTVFYQGGQQDDRISIDGDNVELESTLQLLRMLNVQQSQFNGGGGENHLQIENSGKLDLVAALGDRGEFVMEKHRVKFDSIASVEANAVDNALAAYDLERVDFRYNLNSIQESINDLLRKAK